MVFQRNRIWRFPVRGSRTCWSGASRETQFPFPETMWRSVATSLRQGAATKAEAAVKTILLELEPCQRVTDDFFDLPLPQLRQPCQRGQAAHEESFPPAAFILPPPLEQELAQYLSSNKEAFDATRSLLQQLPPCLEPWLDSLVDWNHRSLGETISLAQGTLDAQGDSIGSCGVSLSLVRLWQACILGGVQGILYMIASAPRRND